MEKIHLPVSVQVKNVAITDFDMKLDQKQYYVFRHFKVRSV